MCRWSHCSSAIYRGDLLEKYCVDKVKQCMVQVHTSEKEDSNFKALVYGDIILSMLHDAHVQGYAVAWG